MGNPNQSVIKKVIWILFAIASLSFVERWISLNSISYAIAETSSESSNAPPPKRDIHRTFEEEENPIDLTNPMELMDRLRRASAMNDATSPADAIDEALKAFDDNEVDQTFIENPMP